MKLVISTLFVAVLTACGGLSDDFKDCGCSDKGQVCVMDPFDGAESFAENLIGGECGDLPVDCEFYYNTDDQVLELLTDGTDEDCRNALCPNPATGLAASSGSGETFVQCERF